MNHEVDQLTAQLRDAGACAAQQKATLQRMAEILEEDYILNLPPQKAILVALATLEKRTKVAPGLKAKAKQLGQQYRV
ncbi:MAG: hypothetical protein ACI81V_000318 [Lentimonas sp.]|jgi:hypothetical protein